jgi:hypothetical protein
MEQLMAERDRDSVNVELVLAINSLHPIHQLRYPLTGA